MKQVSFGKYTLLRRLTQGGMAELFLSRIGDQDRADAELVVIKLVSSRYAKDPTFTSMFEDEVRIAARLNHPNIGHVVDVGHVAGHYFLAMEHLHGQDLRLITRRCLRSNHAVPVPMIVQVGVKICRALQYAHDTCDEAGTPLDIIHRDVSPSNIMLTYDGEVKLIDFGIAKAAGRSTMTIPGTIKGKVRYLSPEQVLGKELDHRSDLFTLGTSLWEASMGRHLFTGSTPVEIYTAIIKEPIRTPSSIAPDFPPGLEAIILRALSQDRDDRYASADELRRDLEAFAGAADIALDDGAAAAFMTSIFVDEARQWREARAAGKSLIDHLLSSSSDEDHAHDLDEVLSLEDGRMTIPEPRDPAPAPPASDPEPDAEDQATMLGLGLGGGGEPPAPIEEPDDEEPDRKKTIMYGEMIAAPLAPPKKEQRRRVSADGHVAVAPGGKALAATEDPDAEEANRPTVMVDMSATEVPEDERPTIMPGDLPSLGAARPGDHLPEDERPTIMPGDLPGLSAAGPGVEAPEDERPTIVPGDLPPAAIRFDDDAPEDERPTIVPGDLPPAAVRFDDDVPEDERPTILPGDLPPVGNLFGQDAPEDERPTILPGEIPQRTLAGLGGPVFEGDHPTSFPDGDVVDEEDRPTLIDDMSVKFRPSTGAAADKDAAGAADGAAVREVAIGSAETLAVLTGGPEPSGSALPEPIIGRDRDELEAQRLEARKAGGERKDKEARAQTGDWAHQATADGKKRVGTHPYFKELKRASDQHRLVTAPRSSSSKQLLTILGIVVLSAAIVIMVVWLVVIKSRKSDTAAMKARPPATSTKPVARKPVVPLRSAPPRAIIYDSADGRQLGITPFDVPVEAGKPRAIELHLAGYKVAPVTLKAGDSKTLVTLVKKSSPASPGSPPPRKTAGDRKKKKSSRKSHAPPALKKKDKDLKDPFGANK